MRKFINCDVFAVLGEIMRHNTEHWQEDFDIDKEILSEAADDFGKCGRRFLWMSRPNGTHCLKEKDVYLKDTSANHTWRYYDEQTNENIIAYAVEIEGFKDGVLKGDLYELDYHDNVKQVRESAVSIEEVELFCENEQKILIPYTKDWVETAKTYDYFEVDFLPEDYAAYSAALNAARAERLTARYADWDLEKLKMEYGEDGQEAFSIYQLKSDEYRFESYVRMRSKGYEPTAPDYEMIYTDELNGATLNDIYERFNMDHPKDYVGYSLSVSDVIVLIKDNKRMAYMVDSFGFKELPDYFCGSSSMQMQSDMEM